MYNQIVIVRLFAIVLIYLKLNALCQGAISLIVPRLETWNYLLLHLNLIGNVKRGV